METVKLFHAIYRGTSQLLVQFRDYVNQLDFAKAEGRAEERSFMISMLKKKGMSDEEIAYYLDIYIEEVKSV